MGTPRYMSPEQARGEEVDARTDIFSLGVVLYEMVAGRRPVRGDDDERRDRRDPARRAAATAQAADAPPKLERIVGKALRKDREERYQKRDDLLADLKQLSHETWSSTSKEEETLRSGKAPQAGLRTDAACADRRAGRAGRRRHWPRGFTSTARPS